MQSSDASPQSLGCTSLECVSELACRVVRGWVTPVALNRSEPSVAHCLPRGAAVHLPAPLSDRCAAVADARRDGSGGGRPSRVDSGRRADQRPRCPLTGRRSRSDHSPHANCVQHDTGSTTTHECRQCAVEQAQYTLAQRRAERTERKEREPLADCTTQTARGAAPCSSVYGGTSI